jgi:septal ring factor EnvC (AmiA/AmiB activator)
MPYGDEIKKAIYRIEQDIDRIEREISELNSKIEQLQIIKSKKERDIRILRSHFNNEPSQKKQMQTSLVELI